VGEVEELGQPADRERRRLHVSIPLGARQSIVRNGCA
jgi:hypothetical protein